jgi:mediator of RNA polymerase II transcription subunit 7
VEQGIAQLYTPPGTPDGSGSGSHSDRALILKRIAKSLLLNFLELMGIMSVNPLQYAEKVQDLRTLFINFHHLLNEYRPHQARESLIMMMEDQLERSKSEIEGIEGMKMKVEGILAGLEPPKPANGDDEGQETSDLNQRKYEDDEAIWEELVNEFG